MRASFETTKYRRKERDQREVLDMPSAVRAADLHGGSLGAQEPHPGGIHQWTRTASVSAEQVGANGGGAIRKHQRLPIFLCVCSAPSLSRSLFVFLHLKIYISGIDRI